MTTSQIKLFPLSAFTENVDGKSISLYTLKNNQGTTLQVTNFGARIVNLWTKDKFGNFRDIVLGYDHIDKYIYNKGERFLGSVIGRYGNRIAGGQFILDGITYQLPVNNGRNCLHGGNKGFDVVVWKVVSHNDQEVVFHYLSKDGEEGFPGNLEVTMRYFLKDDNSLEITYKATTDKATPVNLTHHSFFNLKGEGAGTINDHILEINADQFIPVDDNLIPTGEIRKVENTSMDFRQPTEIGKRLPDLYEQLQKGNGYDHTWVLKKTSESELSFAAKVVSPESGITMSVYTTEPGMQFYGGNFFDGKTGAKNGQGTYERRGSLALETQHFPDSPNQPKFPNSILRPGEIYQQTCVYQFGIDK